MKTALRLLVPLFILSLQFYPKIVISSTQNSHYVMQNCEKSNNTYIIGSSFHSMLNDTLFSVLPAKALKTAFANSTNGTGIDQINALFYCRGDVNPLGCHECVVAAADKVTNRCQSMKEAVVWFEECTLRYSNRSIFSIDERSPLYIYTNKTGILNEDLLNHLNDEFDIAMDELIKQAASFRNLQGFATTQLNVSSTKVLQCDVQCSPDISGAPCEECLKSAMRQRDKWADTMIFMPSCFVKVALYNSTKTTTSPPPPDGNKELTPAMIVAISVGCGIFAIVAILATVFCYIRYWPDSPGQRTQPRIFTYIQLTVATNNFTKRNFLGEGGFGCVYRGVLRGQKVAIKRLKEIWGSESRQLQCTTQFRKEVEYNFSAVHENIVKVVGYCHQGDHKLLVYELVENSSLKRHLQGTKHGILTWENRKRIAVGCARGLRYLHHQCEKKIIHRDIKPSNILLDFNYEPKLADFGLAMVFPDDASYVKSVVKGTYGYLDPQYFDTNKLTQKSDVYSFGIVLLDLITGLTLKTPNYDPGYVLLSLLRHLPDSAANVPENSSDGPNHPVCHGRKDSTSDGGYASACDNPQTFDGTSIEGQEDLTTTETPHGPTIEITVTRMSLEGPNYFNDNIHIDPDLEANYDVEGMGRMIICAAMCVHSSRNFRLSMIQVVELLESGSLPLSGVAQMIASVGSRSSEPESSSSNVYPDRLGLADLKRLATRVLMHS